MASVSSLDKDIRNLRLGKYTSQAANEVRKWIEDTLGEPLAPGDLLDALKDGTALCKYEFFYNSGPRFSERDSLILNVGSSTSRQDRQASDSSSPQCLLFRWKTSPTSFVPANRPL